MNQRLLITIAVLLLLVGIIGLLMSGDSSEEPETVTKPVVVLTTYSAAKPLSVGDRLDADSYNKKTIQIDADSENIPDNMPQDINNYLVIQDIPVDENITLQQIQPPNTSVKDFSVMKDYFIYELKVKNEYSSQLSLVSQGDRVDVWLKYFIDDDVSDYAIQKNAVIDENGNKIKTIQSRMIRVLKNKRFIDYKNNNSINSVLSGRDDNDENKSKIGRLSIEINSEDMKKIYSSEYIGDFIVFPANESSNDLQLPSIVPKTVTEIRANTRNR